MPLAGWPFALWPRAWLHLQEEHMQSPLVHSQKCPHTLMQLISDNDTHTHTHTQSYSYIHSYQYRYPHACHYLAGSGALPRSFERTLCGHVFIIIILMKRYVRCIIIMDFFRSDCRLMMDTLGPCPCRSFLRLPQESQ